MDGTKRTIRVVEEYDDVPLMQRMVEVAEEAVQVRTTVRSVNVASLQRDIAEIDGRIDELQAERARLAGLLAEVQVAVDADEAARVAVKEKEAMEL